MKTMRQWAIYAFAISALVIGCVPAASGQLIFTVAGNGSVTGSLSLGGTAGVAVDGLDNIYVATGGGHQVIKITPAGEATVFAGTGIAGYGGDLGSATAALLQMPIDLYLRNSKLYIADQLNRVIRMVDLKTDKIYTVAGDGTASTAPLSLGGTAGVAVDSAGNIYVATGGTHTVKKITPEGTVSVFAGTGMAGFSGDGGPATAAQLNLPEDLYIRHGRLYIADMLNRRVRTVRLTDNKISTVAGDGTENYSGMATGGTAGIAVDEAGNVFVSTGGAGHLIRKVDTNEGSYADVTAASDDGGTAESNVPAATATLNGPASLYIKGKSLYVADQGNRYIRQIHDVAMAEALPVGLSGFGYVIYANKSLKFYFDLPFSTDLQNIKLQSSQDGKQFMDLTTVPVHRQQEDSHYEPMLPLPEHISYYRLKVTETTGTVTYSPVLVYSARGMTGRKVLRLYPNPVGNALYISGWIPGAGKYIARIIDMRGRVVLERLVLLQKGESQWMLPTGALSKGVYFLQLLDQQGRDIAGAQKVIKTPD